MTRALSVRKEQSRGIVPAEGNFEEHPYFRVGDRNAGTGIMHFENELRTRDGNVMQQSWIVRAAHGRGLPGRYDQDVYVALMQLIDAKGLPPDGWVSFSVYELVELMGKRHSGREYRQVRESLQRLATTSVESKNAFYHKGRKAYISDTFSLLTEVKLAEYEEIAGERKDRNRVHLSQYFVDSYRANYLKHIDARFYWSLSSPIAKRLYRLVDKKRGGRRSWEVELFSLKSRIPLSDYRYASKIKEKLAPAHEELISQGFLKSLRRNSTPAGSPLQRALLARRRSSASNACRPRGWRARLLRDLWRPMGHLGSCTTWRPSPIRRTSAIPPAGSKRPSRATTSLTGPRRCSAPLKTDSSPRFLRLTHLRDPQNLTP
jgi:hypothetical protein